MPELGYRKQPLWRRSGGLAAAFLIAFWGLWIAAVPAQAAAGALQTSDPVSRAESNDQPGYVTLVFDGKVDSDVAKVLVLAADGTNVTSGPLIVEGTNVATQLRSDLAKGTYTVHYRVNGSGGQPRGGAFQFAYGQGQFADPADKSWTGTAEEPEILRGDDPNGPEVSEPPRSEQTPSVEVTSSERATRTTAPPRTTDPTESDDPDSTATGGSDDPSKSDTASAVPADGSGTGRAFLIGGIVLLVAVVGTTYGVYRSRKGGTHS